ncbi:MAG: hypothetical protein CSA97_03025 [Bacteroidetes bacterium]|nr:MAG: hypothetical protein CSA97_03025 [Bacteroidota bacterium]
MSSLTSFHLIADGGSTSVKWALVDAQSEAIRQFRSLPLNPILHSHQHLEERLSSLVADHIVQPSYVRSIRFYGAACGPDQGQEALRTLFQRYFPNASIVVDSDLMAAAVASYSSGEGVVGILGTGSNAAYYAGGQLEYLRPSLGFILGDEGSGAAIGKRVIRDWLYDQLDASTVEVLHRFHGKQLGIIRSAEGLYNSLPIVSRVYGGSDPSAFLASFAKTATEHRDLPYFATLLQEVMLDFVRYLAYPQSKGRSASLRLVGSLAERCPNELSRACREYGLVYEGAIANPIDEMIAQRLWNE